MTRELLEAFEENHHSYCKEKLAKYPIDPEGILLIDNLSSMHGAVMDGARLEHYDLKDFYLRLFYEDGNLKMDVYKAYIHETLYSMATEEHPFTLLYDWFRQTLHDECFREGLFNA